MDHGLPDSEGDSGSPVTAILEADSASAPAGRVETPLLMRRVAISVAGVSKDVLNTRGWTNDQIG
jgi:hypothetical protein